MLNMVVCGWTGWGSWKGLREIIRRDKEKDLRKCIDLADIGID